MEEAERAHKNERLISNIKLYSQIYRNDIIPALDIHYDNSDRVYYIESQLSKRFHNRKRGVENFYEYWVGKEYNYIIESLKE